jgi:hypothetical protein
MKIARRQFLYLAAGAAVLPALSVPFRLSPQPAPNPDNTAEATPSERSSMSSLAALHVRRGQGCYPEHPSPPGRRDAGARRLNVRRYYQAISTPSKVPSKDSWWGRGRSSRGRISPPTVRSGRSQVHQASLSSIPAGRYAQVIARADRPKFKSPCEPTVKELAAATEDSFAANAGTWKVSEADKLLIQLFEAALRPNNEGTLSQKRDQPVRR